MKDVFSTLREQMLAKTRGRDPGDFLIRGLWKTDLLFNPNPDERTFKHTYLLAQTVGQGCCYCAEETCMDHTILGSDAREVVQTRSSSAIAVLDSLFATIPRTPQEVHEVRGNSIEKTGARNSILLKETERLLAGGGKGDKARIVNVGVVGDLLRKLKGEYPNVMATDFDEVIVGMSMHGVTIEHGSRTAELVRESDVAIVTGMTLATCTLEKIIEAARSNGAKLLIFAETGANFGEEYCQTLGIDAVVSEPFPFYIFQGTSRIEVYRNR